MYVVVRAAAFAGVMLWCSFGGDWFGGVRLPPMALDTDLASSVKASDNLFLLDNTGVAPHHWNIVPSGVSLLSC